MSRLSHLCLSIALIVLCMHAYKSDGLSCNVDTCEDCIDSTGCANTTSEIQQALEELYYALNGPGWYNSSDPATNTTWLKNDTNCSPAYCCWDGVMCCGVAEVGLPIPPFTNCSDFEVMGIFLDRMPESGAQGGYSCVPPASPTDLGGLTGTLPIMPLCKLRCALQILSLNYNDVTGTIPPGLSSLSQLRVLYLSYNWLNGTLPSFYDADLANGLVNLRQLDVQQNCLVGPFPADVCRGNETSNLQDASFGFNMFTGSIPTSTCNNLIMLDVQNNWLTGDIDVTKVSGMRILRTQNNLLNGSITSGIQWAVVLDNLIANGNRLTGRIPDEFGRLQFLSTVSLSDNLFTGSLPESLTAMESLGVLALNNNHLNGSIPAGFSALGNLNLLNLSKNFLTGSIPHLASHTWRVFLF